MLKIGVPYNVGRPRENSDLLRGVSLQRYLSNWQEHDYTTGNVPI